MTRLIDADAFKKQFSGEEHYWALKIIDMIDNAPTVEERPQGKWIRDIQGDTICSNCGFECLYNEEGLYSLGRYCHHCGADMRGGADNDPN